jgi:hypothetical protein
MVNIGRSRCQWYFHSVRVGLAWKLLHHLHPRSLKFEGGGNWEVGSAGRASLWANVMQWVGRWEVELMLVLGLGFPSRSKLVFETVPNKRERERSGCFFLVRDRDVACVSTS